MHPFPFPWRYAYRDYVYRLPPAPFITAAQAALERSKALLCSMLTPGQLATYTAYRYIAVRGSDGGYWMIACYHGTTGNVYLRAEDGVWWQFCAQLPGSLPEHDTFLAQLLQLARDESGFRKVAVPLGPSIPPFFL